MSEYGPMNVPAFAKLKELATTMRDKVAIPMREDLMKAREKLQEARLRRRGAESARTAKADTPVEGPTAALEALAGSVGPKGPGRSV